MMKKFRTFGDVLKAYFPNRAELINERNRLKAKSKRTAIEDYRLLEIQRKLNWRDGF